MENIIITDSKQDQIEIGQRLFQEKASIYTENIVAAIKSTITRSMTSRVRQLFSEQDLFFKSIYDYWVYGNDISEEFSLRFVDKTHEQKKEYTTLRTRTQLLDKINTKEDAYLLNDKYEAYKLLEKYYLRDVIKIAEEDDFELFLQFIKEHPVFVAKPCGAGLAIGVHKVDSRDYPDKHGLFVQLLSEGRSCEQKYNWCRMSSMVLEELIDQVEELAKIHPYSVNGVRVTTLRQGNDVRILYPWFKVGVNKCFVTSAAQGTFDAGIDANTGIVNTDGFMENGEGLAIHPNTNISFKGYRIPKWDMLLDTVNRLAFEIPTLPYTGWDLVLTPKGWCVMEGNYAGDFMWQMFNQKGFRREFEEMTGLSLNKDFWWQK